MTETTVLSRPGAPKVAAVKTHTVRLVDGSEFLCPGDERLLVAMERTIGRIIPVGCRRGGCGVCRVRIVEGAYTSGPMSAAHVSSAEQDAGYALACCVYPASDLVVELAPKPKAAVAPAAVAHSSQCT